MEGRCKHKDNTRCVIEEETEALSIKPFLTISITVRGLFGVLESS